MFLLMELKKIIFRWDKMGEMTWCKLYTHLSWLWCMNKPNSGNSGVRNIVHSTSPRCTIFRTPLLPSLGFFIHPSQERCVYTITTSHNMWDVATKKQYLTLKGSVSRHLSVSILVLACSPSIHNTNNQYFLLSMVCRQTMHAWVYWSRWRLSGTWLRSAQHF